MQKIDLASWPRAELFRFFSAVSHPFYSVTFRVDVTNLHAYTKAITSSIPTTTKNRIRMSTWSHCGKRTVP